MIFFHKRLLIICAAILALSFSGNAKPKKRAIKMATTTSTDNSGLLDALLPVFQKETGITIQVIAVGTGKALKHGENGDVDLVFVHARKAEDTFINKGYGVYRKDVMYNDFVILGPKSDLAEIPDHADAVVALKAIAESKQSFVSRGDESGTHKKEKSLWSNAGITPSGKWYIEAGQGMGAVLTMANEKQAYTLSDRGTFIAFEDKIDLVVQCEGDKRLFNPYGIMAVNPRKHKSAKYKESKRFIDWITSKEGQDLIGGFRVKGKQLFIPSAK